MEEIKKLCVVESAIPSLARRAADRYVQLINAKQFSAVGNLFSDDAVMLPPSGEVVKGREEIGRLYREVFSQVVQGCKVVSYVQEGDRCVVELEPMLQVPVTGFIARAIDHFTVDGEGRINRLAVYLNPARALESLLDPN